MADYHKVLGIDLGTTFSVVAVYALGKDVTVIPNPQNQRTTASVVYIGKNGQIAVGEAARQKLVRDPEGVIIEAKRLMGEWGDDGGKRMVAAAGREFDPEFVSACILKELKGYAEKFIGEPIHDAVITVPAYFKEPQKNATREAARLARLNPRLIVNEPTAAAVAYGLEADEDRTFIVYDFGGGTFDVSIVRVKDGRNFDILGTGGDSRLGGGDIDQLLIDWVLANMRRDHGRDFSKDSKLVGRIRLEAERVKINICSQDAEQEFFLEAPAPDIEQISYFIGPGEFKKMIRPILDRTLAQVDVAMSSAEKQHELSWDDIDSFILVGGSSKIPHVKQMLLDRFKKPIKADLNPDEIVAIGAARLAVDYRPSTEVDIHGEKSLVMDQTATLPEVLVDAQIKDVVSHTLGIGTEGDIYSVLIEKDTYIPCKKVQHGYTTSKDGQTSILVPVYQGDNPKASENYHLGDCVIDNLQPAPVGTHHFEVTFALDVDGVFFGEVKHVEKNETKTIKLQRGHDELVEKRRVELADAVDRGYVKTDTPMHTVGAPGMGAPGKPADSVSQLIDDAQAAMDSLPESAQAELTDALARLMVARNAKNMRDQSSAVLKITAVLSRHTAA